MLDMAWIKIDRFRIVLMRFIFKNRLKKNRATCGQKLEAEKNITEQLLILYILYWLHILNLAWCWAIFGLTY